LHLRLPLRGVPEETSHMGTLLIGRWTRRPSTSPDR
jgi:hypothetical protein